MPTPTVNALRDSTEHVRAHLARQGFEGRVLASTESALGGLVTTRVRADHARSVPWTPRLADWLVEALKSLPGRTEIRRPVPTVIWVTWDGAGTSK